MDKLWAPWRMAYIGAGAPEDAGCFLCAMAADDHPHVLERTPLTVTVLNRFPYSSGHLMVVPRAHLPDILALDTATGTALFLAQQRAVRALLAAMAPQGFNLGVNHGFVAGGSVDTHLHVHVVPRWAGDTNFMPVLAEVKVLPEALEESAARLREAYARLA